jgi:hypothetical protein
MRPETHFIPLNCLSWETRGEKYTWSSPLDGTPYELIHDPRVRKQLTSEGIIKAYESVKSIATNRKVRPAHDMRSY